jgi:hypothetical protein
MKMPKYNVDNIVAEGARIGRRNFAGEQGKYNAAGNRNFCYFMEHDLGLQLEEDGWNIRWAEPRDPEEPKQPFLQVSVAFNSFPPRIIIVSGRGKTQLTEDTVKMLDWAEIANVDLTIRPYSWEVNGKSGIKAYLKSMWVTLKEDEFESKYYDVPDSALSAMIENVGD